MQGQFLGDDIEIAIDATVAGAQPSDGEVYFIAVKKAAIGKTVGNGTVEAISNSAKRVYGVQFHPEQMNNDTGNRCMKQFVAICTN